MPKYIPVIAGVMLLLAIPSVWPYAYFQVLRWIVCGTAAFAAYGASQQKKNLWVFILAIIAIVFNPIAPIYLAKNTWIFLDGAAAVLFFTSLRYLKYA